MAMVAMIRRASVEFYTACQYHSCVDIQFDPAKDAENQARRGLPLAFGAVVIEAQIGTVVDDRHEYGEVGLKSFAMIDGLWFVCTHTVLGRVCRIISVHRVREKEAKRWLA